MKEETKSLYGGWKRDFNLRQYRHFSSRHTMRPSIITWCMLFGSPTDHLPQPQVTVTVEWFRQANVTWSVDDRQGQVSWTWRQSHINRLRHSYNLTLMRQRIANLCEKFKKSCTDTALKASWANKRQDKFGPFGFNA